MESSSHLLFRCQVQYDGADVPNLPFRTQQLSTHEKVAIATRQTLTPIGLERVFTEGALKLYAGLEIHFR